jgi:glycosyltransferase involved in cell wall biosynthesis
MALTKRLIKVMRILIDLQGAQATHHQRGIGRYSLSLALAMVRQREMHEIHLLLNAHFAQSIEEIQSAFAGHLPEAYIHLWQAIEPFDDATSDNQSRRAFAEQLRSATISAIKPDVLLITSLFEGPDNAGLVQLETNDTPTAVVLYDLIPWIHKSRYLSAPRMLHWYEERLEQLKKADLLLSISQHSRSEAIEYLDWPADRVVNISSACDSTFVPMQVPPEMRQIWLSQHGLTRPFLMYTGGLDQRKNIERLIRAFAKLPLLTRQAHQLLVVCVIDDGSKSRLQQEADQAGLLTDEVIFTGYVTEEHLVGFYNACKAFVFPSWHEGFGLPVLEAMRCGKAVIAANNTSLPEVVGYAQALFDPFNEEDIRDRIEWVLSNDEARHQLEQHAQVQSAHFDWDATANRALRALVNLVQASKPSKKQKPPRLACVSPLPPEQSGISDYTAQLLKVLIDHYDIEVIVEQNSVSDEWVLSHCPIRSVDWFKSHHGQFDRVLYHFGNSHFHAHMLELIEQIPGVVVLHDFYISGLQSHHLQGGSGQSWRRMLYASHGYSALLADQTPSDRGAVLWQYPCNLTVLQQALGIIVHSDFSLRLAHHWYGNHSKTDWEVIPLLREKPVEQVKDQASIRQKLQLPPQAFVVCSFGLVGPHKLHHELLDAFLGSALAKDPNTFLVFVGANETGPYGQCLSEKINQSGIASRIRITGWADVQDYQHYLMVADLGVQLRTLSRGETSAAVLDCMIHGIPTIVNANGSMADLDPSSVWRLEDNFYPHELSYAIETLWQQPAKRQELSHRARQILTTRHDPVKCALLYQESLERFYQSSRATWPAHLQNLKKIGLSRAEYTQACTKLAQLPPPQPRAKQLLVDISELVRHDARTGIQRVTRAILNEWLQTAMPGWRIEPVWANQDEPGFRDARQYTASFMGLSSDWALDEPVQAHSGDVFLGLDLQPNVIPAQRPTLREWQIRGVRICFVVYDLLPVQHPEFFVEGAAEGFTPWLATIAQSDAIISISQSTRDAFKLWLQDNQPEFHPTLQWFHLGADVEQSKPSRGLPDGAPAIMDAIHARTSFLMVGTLEPRKGHSQVLDAFDELWRNGQDLNLVIVGKQGWLVDAMVERLQQHPEKARKLFWLQGVSDEMLDWLYQNSTALIAASYAEGYGLPLIEASRHGCPVLARDIPVFREVAGIHAHYFAPQPEESLSGSILSWLELHAQNRHPCSWGMHTISWKKSAQKLRNLACMDDDQATFTMAQS